ncbi:uncharacterized protein AAG666_009814 isoform 1-T6 [Megaptera novaeangliae]
MNGGRRRLLQLAQLRGLYPLPACERRKLEEDLPQQNQGVNQESRHRGNNCMELRKTSIKRGHQWSNDTCERWRVLAKGRRQKFKVTSSLFTASLEEGGTGSVLQGRKLKFGE